MNIYYTKTYFKEGDTPKEQERISKTACSLGYREIPIYCDRSETDSIEQCDLNVQMDGCFAPFSNNGVLLMQYPCGGGVRYDRAIIDHARLYAGALVVIYKHRSVAGSEISPEEEQELMDMADLVVEPYQMKGFDEELLTRKEIIDALLAVTYDSE